MFFLGLDDISIPLITVLYVHCILIICTYIIIHVHVNFMNMYMHVQFKVCLPAVIHRG